MRAKYDRGRRGTPRRPARRAASTYGTRSSDRFLPRESRKLEQASVHLKLFAYLRILTLSTLRDHTLSKTPFFTPKRGIFHPFWGQPKKSATKHALPKFQQDFPTKNGVPHLPHHPHPAVLNVHAALWCLVQPPSVQVIDGSPLRLVRLGRGIRRRGSPRASATCHTSEPALKITSTSSVQVLSILSLVQMTSFTKRYCLPSSVTSPLSFTSICACALIAQNVIMTANRFFHNTLFKSLVLPLYPHQDFACTVSWPVRRGT